jgi:hypothetical protein
MNTSKATITTAAMATMATVDRATITLRFLSRAALRKILRVEGGARTAARATRPLAEPGY